MQITSISQCLLIALGILFFLVAVQSYHPTDQQLWSAFSIIFCSLGIRQQTIDNGEEMES